MRRIAAGFCLLCVVVAGITSAAGEERPISMVPASPADVVLVVDGSAGMKAADPDGIWRAAVLAMAATLSPDDRIGVVVAGRAGELAMPLAPADDIAKLKGIVRSVRSRGPHADIVAGLETAMTLFLESGSDRKRVIVLLTASPLLPDPARVVGVPPGGDAAGFLRDWLRTDLLPRMKTQGVEVFAVGLGTSADGELLAELADGTALSRERPHRFLLESALQLPGSMLEIATVLTEALVATVLTSDGLADATADFLVDPWLDAPRILLVGNARATLVGPDGKKAALQSPVPGMAIFTLPGYEPRPVPGVAALVALKAAPAGDAGSATPPPAEGSAAPAAATPAPAEAAASGTPAVATPTAEAAAGTAALAHAPTDPAPATAAAATPAPSAPTAVGSSTAGQAPAGLGVWRCTVAAGGGASAVYLVGRSRIELQAGDYDQVTWEGNSLGLPVRVVAMPPLVPASLTDDLTVEARILETGALVPLARQGDGFLLDSVADRIGPYTVELSLSAGHAESGARLAARRLAPIRIEVLPRPLVTIEGLRETYAEGESIRAEAIVSVLKAQRDEVLSPEIGWFVTDTGPAGKSRLEPQAADGKYLFELSATPQGSHILAVEIRPRWARDGRLLPAVKVGDFKFQVGPPPLPPLPELTVRIEGLKNKYEYGESITANFIPVISGKPAVALLEKARAEAVMTGQGEDLTVPLLETADQFELRLVASGSGPMSLKFRLNAQEKGTGRVFPELHAGPFEFQVPELPSVSMRVDGLRTEYELGSMVVAAVFPSVSRRGYELSEQTAVNAVLVWESGETTVPMERDGPVFGLRFEPPASGEYTLQFVISGRDKVRSVLLPQDSSAQKAYRFAVYPPRETGWGLVSRLADSVGGWPVVGAVVVLAFVLAGLGFRLALKRKKKG